MNFARFALYHDELSSNFTFNNLAFGERHFYFPLVCVLRPTDALTIGVVLVGVNNYAHSF